jgi:hypothetical protein
VAAVLRRRGATPMATVAVTMTWSTRKRTGQGVRWGLKETDEGSNGAHRGREVAMAVASIPSGMVTAPTAGVDRRQEVGGGLN